MMNKFESSCGRIKLYHADCRDIEIPKDSVVITDPPFKIGTPHRVSFTNRKKGTTRILGKDFGKDFDNESLSFDDWVPKMANTVISFYGTKGIMPFLQSFINSGYEIVQDFHWCKAGGNPPPMRNIGFAWGTESGFIFRKIGTRHFANKKAGYSVNYLFCSKMTNLIHSTQKPVKLMKWLVNTFADMDHPIADPFMGSGTTGVACVSLGIPFTGIEKKKEYFELAKRRILAEMDKWEGSFKLGI